VVFLWGSFTGAVAAVAWIELLIVGSIVLHGELEHPWDAKSDAEKAQQLFSPEQFRAVTDGTAISVGAFALCVGSVLFLVMEYQLPRFGLWRSHSRVPHRVQTAIVCCCCAGLPLVCGVETQIALARSAFLATRDATLRYVQAVPAAFVFVPLLLLTFLPCLACAGACSKSRLD